MQYRLIVVLATVFFAGCAFLAGVLADHFLLARVFASRKPEPSAAPAPAQAPADPRRDALVNYLDGKTITLNGSGGLAEGKGTSHTIRKGEIEAVQFPSSMAKGSGEPWRPDVHFILNTGKDRYFIRVTVPYHEIEQKFVFLGFEPSEVVKQ